MRLFFGGLGRLDFRNGVPLTFFGDQNVTIVFLEWSSLLADEVALKEIVNAKGHSGLKPCCCCANVTDANRLPTNGEFIVPSTSTNPEVGVVQQLGLRNLLS